MEELYAKYIKETPMLTNPNYDCEEIAEDLCNVFKEDAYVFKASINGLQTIKIREFEELKDFTHHYFVVVEGYVLDPRYSVNPITIESYVNQIYKNNEKHMNSIRVTLQPSFNPHNVAKLTKKR